MKKLTMKKMLACLLAAVLLLPMGILSLAANGPLPMEGEFGYSRIELVELDEKGKPIMIDKGEWEEQKSIPLFVNGKATAQPGAAYDLASNTLTLTDFNGDKYDLTINVMGDDFTLCVKGNCTLSQLSVNGGGVMQPKNGGSLLITGDGTLTVNADKIHESGISFWPQEEEKTSFVIDPKVKLNIYGSQTAISVSSYNGEFKMQSGGMDIPITKTEAVRDVYVWLEGYSNPWKANIHLCRNAADPEGLYSMSVGYADEACTIVKDVTVARYIHIEKYNLYLEDHQWERNAAGESGRTFSTLEEANAAGFTYILNNEGEDQWMEVDSMGNYGSEHVYADAEGNRYIKDYNYDDQRVMRDIAMTINPIDEIPGEYLFLYTPDVDPATLTEVTEKKVMEGMFDYVFPDKDFEFHIDTSILLGDVNNDGKVTAEDARFALRAAVSLDDTAEGLDFSNPDNRCFIAANVDGEPGISAGDARLILRAAVGLQKLG